MAWPTLIQLFDSQHSHAYDGTEIRETWYIEPYDSVCAFMASMLGRVDVAGGVPNRTLPGVHYQYNWCAAVQCDTVPLDPQQFSFKGQTNLSTLNPQQQRSAQTNRVQAAVESYTSNFLNSTANVDMPGFVSQANKQFSAGAFVVVTYHPLLVARAGTFGGLLSSDMDFVNYRFEERFRKNIPNAGLKLITPPSLVNLFGAGGIAYPSAGIAPEFSEEYQAFIVERRMLNPRFDLAALSAYQNCVENNIATAPNGQQFPRECLRFASWKSEFVQVPQVQDDGTLDGYCRWLNLTLEWDWRTTKSQLIFDEVGAFGTRTNVSWNHVLAYPGTLSWILTGGGVAWYYAKFSSQQFGVDTPAYPFTSQVVGPGKGVLDPLTINP